MQRFKDLRVYVILAMCFTIVFSQMQFAFANDVQTINTAQSLKASDEVRVIIELSGEAPIEYATKHDVEYKNLSSKKQAQLEQKAIAQQEVVQEKIESTDVQIDVQEQFSTIFNGFSGDVQYGDIEKIKAVAGVKNVYIANTYDLPTLPNVTEADQAMSEMIASNATSYKGEGMIVAIIDSGIDVSHKDMILSDASTAALNESDVKAIISANGLSGQYYTEKIPYGYNYADKNTTVKDTNAATGMHGMHVAGIVAANSTNTRMKSIAPEAQLLAMKVFSNSRSTTSSDIYVKAIDDAIKLGADVINMSLGSVSSFHNETSIEALAIKRAMDNGILSAISAGNSGHLGFEYATDAFSSNPDLGTVGSPSINTEALSVASSYGNRMSDFSSWGPTPSLQLKPEISAPGQYIYSTVNNNQYAYMSGTSMASPYVAGVAAAVQQYIQSSNHFATLLPNERAHLLKTMLMNTSDLIFDAEGHQYSPRKVGAGVINLNAALTSPVFVVEKTSKEPKVELKELTDSKFTMTFIATNYSAQQASYKIDTTVLTDAIYEGSPNLNKLTSSELTGATVKTSADTVVVPANGTKEFSVTIDFTNSKFEGYTASEQSKRFDIMKNMFVEGSINLISTKTSIPNLTVPFMGFYGNWDEPSIFDGISELNEDVYYNLQEEFGANITSISTDSKRTYIEPVTIDNKPYYVFSPNNDGSLETIEPLLVLVRNAKKMEYNVLNSQKEKIRTLITRSNAFKMTYENVFSTVYSSPIIQFTWNGKINNRQAADGIYYYEVRAVVDYPNADWQSKLIPIYLDTTAPVVTSKLNVKTKTVSWQTVENGSGIDYYEIYLNGELYDYSSATVSSYVMPELTVGDTVKVVAIDHGLNKGASTVTAEMVIDQTAPISSATIRGEIGFNNWYTSDVIVKLDAQDAEGDIQKIEYKLNGGTWQTYFEAIKLTENGQYTIDYRSIDDSNNIETMKTLSIKIDKEAPIITGVTENTVYNKDVIITYNKGEATLNGVAFNSGDRVSENGRYELAVTSENGRVTIVTFTINKTVPIKPEINQVADYSTKVTGKAKANTTVKLYVNNKYMQQATVSSSGMYTFTISKQKAGTQIKVLSIDPENQLSASSIITVVDKTAPVKPTINQVADYTTKITGKTEANATVKLIINNKTVKTAVASSKGVYTFTISKQKAGTQIKVTATDQAKNESAARVVTVLDKTAPAIAKVTTVKALAKKVTGTAEANATVLVYSGKTLLGKATVSSKGTFTVAIKGQKAKTKLTVYVKDKAGNQSKAMSTIVK